MRYGNKWQPMGHAGFVVSYYERDRPVPLSEANVFLDRAAYAAGRTRGQQALVKPIRLGPYPGKEFEYSYTKMFQNYAIRAREYLVGRRVYSVVANRDDLGEPTDVARFLDSFRITAISTPGARR